jgi:hypothetical protein
MIKAYLAWLRRLRSGKITRQQFKMSLPGAVAWASEQEQTILEWGVPLSGAQLMYAKHLGIARPEQEAVAKSAKLFPSDAFKSKGGSNAGRVTFFNE